MQTVVGVLIAAIVVGVAAFQVGYRLKQRQGKQQIVSAEAEAARIVTETQSRARETVLTAKDEALKIKDEAENEGNRKRQDLLTQERRLQQRREQLDKRYDEVEKRSRKLDQRERNVEKIEREAEEIRNQQSTELERVAQLTLGEARGLLLQAVEKDARQDSARVIREVEMEAREEGERRAREIIISCIQRIASDQVADVTVSTVPLPTDEMKGRIIGRNGRNIRAIEKATGVDLIVDDTPEAITISCFDPVRREVARVAIGKLVLDGRIHPARIEKIVQQTRDEVEATIRQEGESAAYDAGVTGLHPEIIKLMGRMKFRTSYGQNVLAHSVETAHLASMMAHELGANVEIARRGAFLHDLGKAVSHEVEGPHAIIGADIAKRYGVNPVVINCIASHHHEEEQQTVEAVLVEAADAISGARPGARRETLENYVKRIKALEVVADSFPGVAESFAIQAGREIRIMVKPEEIDDLAAIQLARNISKKVEESLEYPGQIKVTVIRETRAVDYAK